MSNHDNAKRGEKKRTEHGPKWEGGGSDNSCVARARKKYKKRAARQLRRTGKTRSYMPMSTKGLTPKLPLVQADDLLKDEDD